MSNRAVPSVSLILPVRNEATHIQACLDSILAQDYPPARLTCLVVDGDSDDETVAIVEAAAVRSGRIRLLRNPRRTMPHGLNIGITVSASEMVGVVSGHSRLRPDYVSRAVAAMTSSGAWSVGGRIVRVAHTPMQRAIAAATASPIGVGDSRHNYSDRSGWVETVFPGFWRRDVFERVGLFDPEMLANEDNELSLRIRRAGGRIWYDASIAVEYFPRETLGTLFHQYHDYARGKIRVLRKHGGGLRWRHAVPGALVAYGVAGGALAFFAPVLRPWWASGLGIYGAVVVGTAGVLARKGAPMAGVALALAALHAAYGIGSWRGLFDWLARPRWRRHDGSVP